MLNPIIHGSNMFSDTLDEMNFNPYRAVKVMIKGAKLYEHQNKIVERMIDAGWSYQGQYSIARDLRKSMLESSESLKKLLKPLGKLEEISDEILWNGIVRNSQIGLFEALTIKMAKEHPNWKQIDIDKTVAYHINTLYGTLPHTWFSKWGRTASSVAFFARNWTVSNIDLVVRATTTGRFGLGMKGLTRDQQIEIGKMNAKHLAKGIFGLVLFANLLQLGFLIITNELKRKKKMKGKIKPITSTFQNENWKHWIDVKTGFETKTGQDIYLVPPLFRYIRDYFGYITQPGKTIYNKIEPLLKQFVEQITNYSIWQRKVIAQRGAPAFDKLKQRIKYLIHGITPSQFYGHKPGQIKTTFEWLIPFTGTWIRKGAPGGKYTSLLWKYRNEKGYKNAKLDEQINELIQEDKYQAVVDTIIKYERYSLDDINQLEKSINLRILKIVAPLNYYWETMGKKEKEKWLEWLKNKGYSEEGLIKELRKEIKYLFKED